MNSSQAASVNPEQLVEKPRSAQTAQPLATGEQSKEKVELPPFNVLLNWITYYHAQTGIWPEPDNGSIATKLKAAAATAATNCQIPENKPLLSIVPAKAGIKKVAVAVDTEATLTLNGSTNYDFRSSLYYSAALVLLETIGPVQAVKPWSEPSILTFASLLAWCHYPAFLTRYNEKGNGLGMYLPLGQWSKSLRMRKATLAASLKELEDAGLIKTYYQTTGNELAAAAPPTPNLRRYYRLEVVLKQPLPIFDPTKIGAASGVFTSQVKNYQPDAGEGDTNPELHVTGSEPQFILVPYLGTKESSRAVSMTHDVNNKTKNYKNIKQNSIKNHEHEASAGVGVSVRVGVETLEEKLEFLSQKARFPGYISPEGLSALDSREALKFASNSALDLNSIQKIYHQVLSAWSTGKCNKNPLGFFHYTLTRYVKQKPSLSNKQLNSPTEFTCRPEPEPEPHFGTGKKVKVSSRFPSTTALAETEEAYLAGQTATALNQETQPCELVDINKIQGKLKEQVVEALKDRFKQPVLASTLSQLNWVISLFNSKLEMRLEKQGSAFLAASTLGQGEFSLIKIAVSQALKVLVGRGYEIDILYC